LAGDVTTKNLIYQFVSLGTKGGYRIPKRPLPRGKSLRFRANYRAKTRPRTIGSRGGGASGPFVFAKSIKPEKVKGIKAREFEKEIAQRRQRNFNNFMVRAWAEAIRG
jgi:hypothetical protein